MNGPVGLNVDGTVCTALLTSAEEITFNAVPLETLEPARRTSERTAVERTVTGGGQRKKEDKVRGD